MANFERVGEMVSSWIWGRATISTSTYLLGGGSSIPAPPGTCLPRGPCGAGGVVPFGALDAAPLPGPAPVVRDRRDVLDAQDLEARGGERADGRLPAAPRTFHVHVDLREPVFLGAPGGGLGGELRGERGRLAGPLEPDVARAGP